MKKFFILLILISTLSFSASFSETNSFKIKSYFETLDGINMLKGNYNIESPFSEDFAIISKTIDDQLIFGVIDIGGDLKIPLNINTKYIEPCSNGLFLIKDSETKLYGYMDKQGEMAINFKFTCANSFIGGYAVVSTSKYKNTFGVIDKKGNFVIKEDYKLIGPYSEGLFYAEPIASSRYEIMDSSGKVISNSLTRTSGLYSDKYPPKFSEARLPILTNYGSSSNTKYYYSFINRGGDQIFESMKQYVYPYSEGLAMISKDKPSSNENLYGFIDTYGEIVIPLLYEKAESFSDGLALVSNYDGENGFINRNGKLIIPFTDKYIMSSFKNGVSVSQNEKTEKYGAFDTHGDIIIPFDYDYISEFNEDSAVAIIDDEYVMLFKPSGTDSNTGKKLKVDASKKIKKPTLD